jgi:hypothetical protein
MISRLFSPIVRLVIQDIPGEAGAQIRAHGRAAEALGSRNRTVRMVNWGCLLHDVYCQRSQVEVLQ